MGLTDRAERIEYVACHKLAVIVTNLCQHEWQFVEEKHDRFVLVPIDEFQNFEQGDLPIGRCRWLQLEASNANVGLDSDATNQPVQRVQDLTVPGKRRSQRSDNELNEFGWRTALLHITARGNEPVVLRRGAEQMDDAALSHPTLRGEHHALPSKFRPNLVHEPFAAHDLVRFERCARLDRQW